MHPSSGYCGVGAGQCGLKRGELALDFALVGGVELIAHLVEGLFGLVYHLVTLIADVDLFLALCVLGSVHLGLCYTLPVEGEVRVRETEKLEGGWTTAAGLRGNWDMLETWTQIALNGIEN